MKSETCRLIQTDSNKRIARSTKVVEAILRGIWIVSEEWLEMSIAQGEFLDEEQFEAVGLISHDQCVGDGGVAKARRAKMYMVRELFCGLNCITGGLWEHTVNLLIVKFCESKESETLKRIFLLNRYRIGI